MANISRTLRLLLFLLPTALPACTPPMHFTNKYLSATLPAGYEVLPNEADDILVLSRTTQGLESSFLVAHLQELLYQPNAQTIRDFKPVQLLATRLESIAEDTRDPACGWQHFRLVGAARPLDFHGCPAAEAVFEVDEAVAGRVVPRRIRRLLVFTPHDLWNIVLAPTDTARYAPEMAVFEAVLASVDIKK